MILSASGLLVALATLVVGFPTTKESSKDAQPTWTELESADREAVLKELTPFLGEVVGPVFITLSSRLELRLIGEDTYMYDAYRLHVPDSSGFPTTKNSYGTCCSLGSSSRTFVSRKVLQCSLIGLPAIIRNVHNLGLLFSLSSFGITTTGVKGVVIGAVEQAQLEFSSSQLEVGAGYYKGVPVHVLERLGMIKLHAAVVKKLMNQCIAQA